MKVINIKDFKLKDINKEDIYFVINEHEDLNETIKTILNSNYNLLNTFGFNARLIDAILNEDSIQYQNFEIIDDFIYELFMNKKTSDDSIVLIYDEQKIIDFVIKRVNHYLNGINYLKRCELNAHSYYSDFCPSSPVSFINNKTINNFYAIAITDNECINGCLELNEYLKRNNLDSFKALYGTELKINNCDVIVICKNNKAKLYLNTCLTRHKLNNEEYKLFELKKNDLIVGISCFSKLMEYAINLDINKLENLIKDYDFIEIFPLKVLMLKYKDLSNQIYEDSIKLIIEISNKLNKLVVASSYPCYTSENYLEFNCLYDYYHKDNKFNGNEDLHFYSSDELRFAFDFLNDEELIEDIVINNPNKIADMCLDIPIDNQYYPPSIEEAYKKLEIRVFEEAKEIYGKNIDDAIKTRINDELKIIKDNDYASIFLLTTRVCDSIRENGYSNGIRGFAGSSFISYLLKISEINPIEYDLPYEVFFGLNGEKTPDFDINVNDEVYDNIQEILKEVAPNNKIITAGAYCGYKLDEAKEIISSLFEDIDSEDKGLIGSLIKTITSIPKENVLHTCGYFIVPNNVNINDFTSLTKVNDSVCTKRQFYYLMRNFYKADFLKHYSENIIDEINYFKINENDSDIIYDQNIIDLLKGNKKYSFIGINDFESEYVRKIINISNPNSFMDFVKVLSLSHGTDVFKDNGELLLKEGKSLNEIVASRDDIYTILNKNYFVDRENAYLIMEDVRKCKGVNKDQEKLLKEHNVPDWFVNSLKKIKYLFSKAHSISYTLNSFRLAWLKIYKPSIFYAFWLNQNLNLVNKDLLSKTLDELNKIVEVNKFITILKEIKQRDINIIIEEELNIDDSLSFKAIDDDEILLVTEN